MYAPTKLMTFTSRARITIGDNCRIHATSISAYEGVTIGDNVLIAANTIIFDSNRHDFHWENPKRRFFTTDSGSEVVIGDNVWIGANVMVLPGVEIGEGAVIAAGAVVTKNIPPKTLAAGVPAKIVYQHDSEN